MPTNRNLSQFEPGGKRSELARLIRRIQTLTLERDQLRQDKGADPELQAKERTLDQLHAACDRRPTDRSRRPRQRRVTTTAPTHSAGARSWILYHFSYQEATLRPWGMAFEQVQGADPVVDQSVERDSSTVRPSKPSAVASESTRHRPDVPSTSAGMPASPTICGRATPSDRSRFSSRLLRASFAGTTGMSARLS